MRYAAPLFLVVVVVAGSGISFWYHAGEVRELLLKEQTAALKVLALIQAEELGKFVTHHEIAELQEQIASFKADPTLVIVRIVNGSGEIVASTQLAEIGSAAQSSTPALPHGGTELNPDSARLTVVAYLLNPRGSAGLDLRLEMTRDLQPALARANARELLRLALGLVYFSVAALLLGWFFQFGVVRRLGAASEALSRVKQGALGVRIVDSGRDEVASLIEQSNEFLAHYDLARILTTRISQALEQIALLDAAEDMHSALARAVRSGLDCRGVAVSRFDSDADKLEIIGVAGDERLKIGARYPLRGTPCELGRDSREPIVILKQGAQSHFPHDPSLAEFDIESYRGAGIFAADGTYLGSLFVYDDKPCDDIPAERGLLRVAAGRAAQEISRVEAEGKLRASQLRLELALETSGASEAEWDVATDAIIVNPRWPRTLGYDPAELGNLRAAYAGLIHPEDQARAQSDLVAHQAGEGVGATEYRARTKDGKWRWVRLNRRVLERDANGKAVRMIGVYLDVHDERVAQEALRNSEARLNLALESASLSVAEWDIERDRLQVGERIVTSLGYNDNDLTSMRMAWAAIAHPEDTASFDASLMRKLKGIDDEQPLEARVRDKNGRWHWLQIRARVTARDRDGRATHMLGVVLDVTSFKETQEALRERTEFLELAVRGSMDGLWSWDAASDGLYLSPRFHELLGYADGDLPMTLSEFLAEIYHPEDRVSYAEITEVIARSPDQGARDLRFRHKDGTYRWFHVRGLATFDQGNKPRRMVGSISDIHERKQRELELAAARRQLRDAIDHIDSGVVMYDADDRLLLWNRQYAEMFRFDADFLQPGMSAEAVARGALSRKRTNLVADNLGDAIEARMHHHRNLTPDWELQVGERWFRISDHATADGGTVGLRTDITTLKQITLALQESELRLRTVLDSSPIGIFFCDESGGLIYGNQLFLNLTGAGSRPNDPDAWLEHIPKDARDRYAQAWISFVQNPTALFENECEYFDLEGKLCVLHARAVPFRREGSVVGFAGTVEDITVRRNAEAARQSLQAQLLQAQKMEAIGQLTGGIAHDFNNVLASVLGYTSLARKIAQANGLTKLDEYMDAVRNAGLRARDLVQKMLAFSRQTPAAEVNRVDLARLVRETMEFLRPLIPTTIRIDVDYADTCEPVLADYVELHQALVNLALNARDAVGEHGHIKISLRSAYMVHGRCASCNVTIDERMVVLSVRDSGGGIAPEYLTRIFEPFFTTKETGKGTGMGLSVTHGVMHRAGGHILVDSIPAQGTLFRLLLRPAPLATMDEMPNFPHSPSATTHGASLLVLDDDPLIGAMLEELLQEHGYRIHTFSNSLDARRWFNEHASEIDAVVTDQTMPGLTGLEFARDVKKLRPDMPIFLCTGYSELVDEDSCNDAGVEAWFQKPIDLDELLSALAHSLSAQLLTD